MEEPLDILGVPTPNPQVVAAPHTDFGTKHRTVIFSTVFPSIFVITLLVVTRQIIRKRKLRNRNHILGQSTSTIYSIPNQPNDRKKRIGHNTHIQVHHGARNTHLNFEEHVPHFHRRPVYKNQENPVYLVPFTALPPDFDFSSRKVQVCSDFVIVKDLDILQDCNLEIPDIHQHEEYQKQVPFNPTFLRNQVMVY